MVRAFYFAILFKVQQFVSFKHYKLNLCQEDWISTTQRCMGVINLALEDSGLSCWTVTMTFFFLNASQFCSWNFITGLFINGPPPFTLRAIRGRAQTIFRSACTHVVLWQVFWCSTSINLINLCFHRHKSVCSTLGYSFTLRL